MAETAVGDEADGRFRSDRADLASDVESPRVAVKIRTVPMMRNTKLPISRKTDANKAFLSAILISCLDLTEKINAVTVIRIRIVRITRIMKVIIRPLKFFPGTPLALAKRIPTIPVITPIMRPIPDKAEMANNLVLVSPAFKRRLMMPAMAEAIEASTIASTMKMMIAIILEFAAAIFDF